MRVIFGKLSPFLIIVTLLIICVGMPSSQDVNLDSVKGSSLILPSNYGDLVYSLNANQQQSVHILKSRRARKIQVPNLNCRSVCKRVKVVCSADPCGEGFEGCMSGNACDMFLSPLACKSAGLRSHHSYRTNTLRTISKKLGSYYETCLVQHETAHALQDSCKVSECGMEATANSKEAECQKPQVETVCPSSAAQKGDFPNCDIVSDSFCSAKASAAFQQCRVDNGKDTKSCGDCKDCVSPCVDSFVGCKKQYLQWLGEAQELKDLTKTAESICQQQVCEYCQEGNCSPSFAPTVAPSPTVIILGSPNKPQTPVPTNTVPPPLPTEIPIPIVENPCDFSDVNNPAYSCAKESPEVWNRLCQCFRAASTSQGEQDLSAEQACLCGTSGFQPPDISVQIQAASSCLSGNNSAHFSMFVLSQINLGVGHSSFVAEEQGSNFNCNWR